MWFNAAKYNGGSFMEAWQLLVLNNTGILFLFLAYFSYRKTREILMAYAVGVYTDDEFIAVPEIQDPYWRRWADFWILLAVLSGIVGVVSFAIPYLEVFAS